MRTPISRVKPTAAALAALILLSGCGQKGALFIPADPDSAVADRAIAESNSQQDSAKKTSNTDEAKKTSD